MNQDCWFLMNADGERMESFDSAFEAELERDVEIERLGMDSLPENWPYVEFLSAETQSFHDMELRELEEC